MKKSDALITATIGFINGTVFYGISKVVEIEIPYLWLLPLIFPPLGVLVMFIVSLIGKRFLPILQAARFFLVGTLNTFVDLGVLNGLMWISGIYSGIFYSIFKGLSFLAASTNSYFWNKHWTFEKKEEVFAHQEYFKFLVIVSIGFLINVGIASFIVNVIGPQFGISEELWANVGAFVAVFFAWMWNFTGAKFIVFKK
jgi:putative flippase GtrA